MHYQTVTPFEQWMRDNIYGKLVPSAEIKELMALAFEGGQKALEQPAQEPVAWMSQGGMLTTERLQAESWVSHGGKATPLYPHSTPDSTLDSTHPHQWQELTNEDIARLILINEVDGTGDVGLARLVEHASRIKNHG
jgi:hypothetical protein